MKFTTTDPCFMLNASLLRQFMLAQGFNDTSVDALQVHLLNAEKYVMYLEKKERLLGHFCRPFSIYLYGHREELGMEALNITFLHELRHYWQQLMRERELLQAMNTLDGNEYDQFLVEWLDRPRRERQLAYLLRPREVDANAFADRYKHLKFLERRS